MDYMAHYEKTPRLRSQGLHAHDYYEIYVHIEGARLYCVDDVIYELKPGQLLVIPPLHMHGLVCDRDLVDYERCYLYLSAELLRQCGFGKINLSAVFDSAATGGRLLFDLTKAETEELTRILVFTESKQNTEDKNSLSVYAGILRLLDLASSKINEKPPESVQSHGYTNPMAEVLHYINLNFTKELTLEELCTKFNLSKSQLSHRFSEYTNKGVYEYILYRRIIYAKELMYTGRSLTEISFECGFSDYSNFLRFFKKVTGMSPSAYKALI